MTILKKDSRLFGFEIYLDHPEHKYILALILNKGNLYASPVYRLDKIHVYYGVSDSNEMALELDAIRIDNLLPVCYLDRMSKIESRLSDFIPSSNSLETDESYLNDLIDLYRSDFHSQIKHSWDFIKKNDFSSCI